MFGGVRRFLRLLPWVPHKGGAGGGARAPIAVAHDFDDYVRALLSARTRLAASKIQLINLDRIRDETGDKWEEIAGQVRATIKEVIMRRLGPRDAFTQMDDDTYIIIFENLSKEDAELECVLIVQEVLQTLFVDKNLDQRVNITTVAVGIDGKVDITRVSLLDIIARLLNEAQQQQASGANPAISDGPHPGASAPLPGGTGENTEPGEARRALPYSGAMQGGAAPAEEGPHAARAAANNADAAAPQGQRRQPAAPRVDMLDPEALLRRLSPDITFRYRPLWDVRRKVLSTYSCIIQDKGLEGYGILGLDPDPYLIPALDFLALGRITYEIQQLHARKSRVLMCCPVNYRTLSDVKAWATYTLLCQRLLRDGLSKDVVFEIYDIPPHDNGRVVYCISKLKPFCRSVIVRLQLSCDDFSVLRGAECDAVTVDITAVSGSEKRLFRMMDEFAENSQNAKLYAQAIGLTKMSHVVGAVGSGFQKISGDIVHDLIERPEFVYRFEARNLLEKMI